MLPHPSRAPESFSGRERDLRSLNLHADVLHAPVPGRRRTLCWCRRRPDPLRCFLLACCSVSPLFLVYCPIFDQRAWGKGGGSSRRLIATLQRVRSRDNQKERETVLLPRRTRRRKRPNSAKTERNLLRPSQPSTLNRRIPSRMGPEFSV